ncbi:MAG TPA: MgtC/SapB family protein [Candidatus Acidoferrales bacterium]|nr:MgtC/SapB family protein [Candidatus Acidoferrales bacterium]
MTPTDGELAIKLLLAMVLGILVGLEREYTHHPAGVRTMAMVALGACLFTALGQKLVPGGQDPTRVAAQVVTGIGFLGAGAILRLGTSIIGLTTAASIWVVASIGMAVGFGYYTTGVVCALIVLLTLVLIRPIERRFFPRKAGEPAQERPPASLP